MVGERRLSGSAGRSCEGVDPWLAPGRTGRDGVPDGAFTLACLEDGRGKTALQAVVAVMRKLLHVIHGMFRSETMFDPSRAGST
jgi:hypothetical protein